MEETPGAHWIVRALPVIAIGFVMTSTAAETDLNAIMDAESTRLELAQASQNKIDDVVQQTESLESEYRQVVKQLDGLNVYNEYIGRSIANQEQELLGLRQSIDQIGSVERQVMPLMIRMLDGLEQFVELDVPFLKEERLARCDRLRSLMDRADVSVAEKFRSLMEAFQIENDFGRTIETYKSTLVIAESTLEVNILRLGRVGLFYQTNNAERTGLWNSATGRWTPLTGRDARNQVRRGIRMARRQVAPDLLLLDIPAPGTSP